MVCGVLWGEVVERFTLFWRSEYIIDIGSILLNWFFKNVITLIGWGLSIISIGIALYQYNDKRKIENLVRSNSWMLFQRINNLGGTVQKAFVEANETNIDKTLYEKIVRSDALAAELYKEAIRLIIISEKDVTAKVIEQWESEGKISGGYSNLFKTYLPEK